MPLDCSVSFSDANLFASISNKLLTRVLEEYLRGQEVWVLHKPYLLSFEKPVSSLQTWIQQNGCLRGGSEVNRILPYYGNLSCRSESVYVISQFEWQLSIGVGWRWGQYRFFSKTVCWYCLSWDSCHFQITPYIQQMQCISMLAEALRQQLLWFFFLRWWYSSSCGGCNFSILVKYLEALWIWEKVSIQVFCYNLSVCVGNLWCENQFF